MLKLKNGVSGFIYDSCHGFVTKVYYEPLTEDKIETINEVIDDSSMLFTNDDDINNAFEFEVNLEEGEELVLSEEEGLNEVIEWIK